jgi:Fe-S-cluster containining protein
MNKILRSEERKAAIERAVAVSKKVRELKKLVEREIGQDGNSHKQLHTLYAQKKIKCPLNVETQCVLYSARPISCRIYGVPVSIGGETRIFGIDGDAKATVSPKIDLSQVNEMLSRLSGNVLHALTSSFPSAIEPTFTLASVVSGRFVQEYFEYLSASG